MLRHTFTGLALCVALLVACGEDEPVGAELVASGGASADAAGLGGSAGSAQAGTDSGSAKDASAGSAGKDAAADADLDAVADATGSDASEAGDAADAAVGLVPDFSLVDDNPNSSSYQKKISPRDYIGKVSAWYFGHAT